MLEYAMHIADCKGALSTKVDASLDCNWPEANPGAVMSAMPHTPTQKIRQSQQVDGNIFKLVPIPHIAPCA